MKRLISLLLALTIIFVLSACGVEKADKHCSNCNESISKDAAFCESCGFAVNEKNTDSTNAEGSTTAEDSTNTQISNDEISEPATSTTPSTSKPTTNTQITSKPTESSKPTASTQITGKPTESSKPITPKTQTPAHTHSYSEKVTNATCTEKGYTTYTCTCGDSYKADYVEASHTYRNYVCTVCGLTDENYKLYQSELATLTAEYKSNVSELEAKISECSKDIEKAQKTINSAAGELATLSPACPQWYLQQYINNWQAYGNTWAATEAAQNAWRQEYNTKRAQLNSTISIKNSEIQANQTNINLYSSAISNLNTTYNNDVGALKIKYGIS